MVSGNIISMTSLSHEEEALLTSLLSHPVHPHSSRDETRTRRRRRKARSAGDGGAAGAVVDAKKRRLSDEQVKFLEMRFGEETKLEFGRKVHLAAELGVDPKQVAVWFQNRRARHKSKQVEEAYLKLKSIHDATVIEKCHLENEVLKLKDMLLQAQEKIKQLSPGTPRATGGSNLIGSPSSSSLSYQLPLVSDSGVVLEEESDLMPIQDYYDFSDYMMEWACFYGM